MFEPEIDPPADVWEEEIPSWSDDMEDRWLDLLENEFDLIVSRI